MANILVGQSGGPTAVINSSLYGVIKACGYNKDKVQKTYGMINGIEGFINGNYIDIDEKLSHEQIELLKTTPGSMLGSCRYRLPSDINDGIYIKIFEKFKKMNIKYVLYIGGNDSMDTVDKLSKYAKSVNSDVSVLGIPKTIDNDLPLTDHTPGFGSAAKYVATAVRDIVIDSNVYDMKAVTIVEIMGRNTGWLTASSVLSRRFEGDNPALIYLPETVFNERKFLEDLKVELEKRDNVVICISEGLKNEKGIILSDNIADTEVDDFGHKRLTGCGKIVEDLVKTNFNIKVRTVELNVIQRCMASLASLTDVNEAIELAQYAVLKVLDKVTGKMVCYVRTNNSDYSIKFECRDVSEICNKEKIVPENFISGDNDISNEFINYALPLIQGNTEVVQENGLPKYCYIR